MGGSAGTGGMAGMASDDRLFVPEGLPNTDLDGEGGLTLIASTLIDGASGPELYAAVRNDEATPVCSAGMMTAFLDETDAVVATGSSALLSEGLYQFTDGSGVIIPCIAPGEIAMTATRDLPDDLVIEELDHLQHRFPAFIVDGIVPVEGFTVSELETVATGDGSAYTGTLTSGLDVAVSDPTVSVFPLNRVGRPLGVATSEGASDIPPGGSWAFETTAVVDLGADYVAYPAASIP
jgi:hypothetical protein